MDLVFRGLSLLGDTYVVYLVTGESDVVQYSELVLQRTNSMNKIFNIYLENSEVGLKLLEKKLKKNGIIS